MMGSTDHEAPHSAVFSTTCYLVPLKPKYSPQHPFLKQTLLSSSLNANNDRPHVSSSATLRSGTADDLLCTA